MPDVSSPIESEPFSLIVVPHDADEEQGQADRSQGQSSPVPAEYHQRTGQCISENDTSPNTKKRYKPCRRCQYNSNSLFRLTIY